MLTLIAESKTMSPNEETISGERFRRYAPEFENEADSIMTRLSDLPSEELAQRIGISHQLAQKVYKLIYEFPNKTLGMQAIKSFTGEVFKALDISSLPEDRINFSESRLLIVSSLYGLLTPMSIIKPYRLDFKIKGIADGEALYKFWKSRLTPLLINRLKTTGENEILNLLPAEAEKCLDWHVLKKYADITRPDFKVMESEDMLRTPHTGQLKKLRGMMVRAILEHRLDSFNEVIDLSTDKFIHYPEASQSGKPCFVSV